MESNFIPPFIIIPMPLDSEGRGPAYEEETVKTVFEIWDAVCQTVSVHNTEEEASEALSKLRSNHNESRINPSA